MKQPCHITNVCKLNSFTESKMLLSRKHMRFSLRLTTPYIFGKISMLKPISFVKFEKKKYLSNGPSNWFSQLYWIQYKDYDYAFLVLFAIIHISPY